MKSGLNGPGSHTCSCTHLKFFVCTFPSQMVIDPEEKWIGPCLQLDTECN